MRSSSVTNCLEARQVDGNKRAERVLSNARINSLGLSQRKEVDNENDGSITWLALDVVESRYLLASASDSSIAAYDVSRTGKATGQPNCLFKVDRSTPEGHKYTVSCATWYPVDTGLFVSGSYDQAVKVWDTNTLQVACGFEVPSQVNAVAMSGHAVGHCLIAVAASDADVRLCDPNSGSVSHTLTGHRDKTWCVAWSPSSEWEVVTGACDGQVILWDIRASGYVNVLNQYNTQTLRRPAKPSRSQRRQSIHSTATAHEGSVTAIVPLPGALHWVTAGTDSRIRLWETSSFRNELVNYPRSYNRAVKARQLAVAGHADLLFHPSGSVIQGYKLYDGELLFTLKGHMDAVNACCYNAALQELYTGSNDHQICAWVPLDRSADGDKDNWSP